MTRVLGVALAVYAPHLLEEALTGMRDEPFITLIFRHLDSYLVFQIMLVVALGMTFLFAQGERPRRAVMGVLALALLGEAHHVVRALASLHYNSGLLTSFPMPIAGALVLRKVLS